MLNELPFSSVRLVAFDFDGVFTDNRVYVSEDGRESVSCSRSDGLGLARLKEVGVFAYIVSTEENPVVSARAVKLQVPCIQGVTDKGESIARICEDMGVNPESAMFVGNDINDIPAFARVGFPVAVADAASEVLPHVIFQTSACGGQGAVREICDSIWSSYTDD